MALKMRYLELNRKVRDVRMLAIQGIAEAGSGHPGASFSAAEIMGVLYFHKMKHKPDDPFWKERDFFINSKAHSAPGFYAVLATAGYIDTREIKTLRKLGSRLQGHPVRYSERQKNHSFPGIEYSGGSEGIGLSVSIGIALAKKRDGQKNRVYTLIGDGESNEGQIWEAAMAASKFKLDNLVAILDRNKIQQDGFTEEIMPLDPVRDKWDAFNWNVVEVNGHKIEQLIDALSRVEKVENKPSIIIANTTKGKGIKHMANSPQWHGKAPPKKHVPILLEELQSEILIAPSIIAGEPENYEEKVRRAERAGADLIHLDIMDGKFVPSTSFFADTIKHLRKISSIPFDAHLMIEKPINHVAEYIDVGCDIVTVHVEACNESEFVEINEMLLKAGISPGIALNPGTQFPSWLIEHLNNIDVMIIMSVNPGFAGQKFIPDTLDKMAEIVKTLKGNNYKGFIEADGGIDATTLQQVFDAGARIMVAGNAVYGSPDINSNIIQLRHKANVAIETKLLELATINDMRSDWIKSRKSMLIPLAKELGIEEDLHAIK